MIHGGKGEKGEKGEKPNTLFLAAQRGLPYRLHSARGMHCQMMKTYFEDLKTRRSLKCKTHQLISITPRQHLVFPTPSHPRHR